MKNYFLPMPLPTANCPLPTPFRRRRRLLRGRLPLLLPLLLLLVPACAPRVVSRLPANQLGRYVRTMVQEEGQSQADWGILARNLRTGKTLISFNADKLFLPASNTKLYTTAAALRLLGPQFRIRTPILASGPVSGGVIEGDLLVIGQGDPTWSARFHDDGKAVFRAWADSLEALEITAISGAIIGVDAVFIEQPQGSGWSWDNDAYYYAAQIAGLSFNENVVDVIIVPRPDWQPPLIVPSPATAYVRIENRLLTLDTLDNPDSLKVKWEIRRPRGANRIIFEGIVRPDTVETGASVEDPVAFTATVLRETLLEEGIAVAGPASALRLFTSDSIFASPTGDTLFVHQSPPLEDIIYLLNKDSQNMMAEILLRILGVGPKEGGSDREGLRRARQVWAGMGVDTTNIVLTDGSGLSRYNKISPRGTVALLTAMQGDTSFFRSLPIAGVDGTLEETFVGSLAERRVFAKTGSLWGGRALSGYLITTKGDRVVFSILINDFLTPVSRVNARIERILELLITT